MYTSYGKAKHDDEEEHSSDDTSCKIDNPEEYGCDEKYHHVMTYEELKKEKKKLTHYIVLRDPYQGESKVMRKRTV